MSGASNAVGFSGLCPKLASSSGNSSQSNISLGNLAPQDSSKPGGGGVNTQKSDGVRKQRKPTFLSHLASNSVDRKVCETFKNSNLLILQFLIYF